MPYPSLDAYRIDNAEEILSPGLLIFRPLLEHNLGEMVRVAGGPERLIPHCKTHKIPQIASRMLELGIRQQKCATIAEAEMLANVGVPTVLIAYQLVGPNIDRLVKLVQHFPQTKFATLADAPQVVDRLSAALAGKGEVEVLLDLNSGMDRTGIQLGPNAIDLYETIASSDGLSPGGLHWYDGHHRQADLQERTALVTAGWKQLTRFRDQLLLSGLPIPRVVAAGTGSFPILAELGEPDLQLSPGTTTFHDDDMVTRFPEQNFIPAQGILTRVVSKPNSDTMTLDVGHKSCAADQPAGQRLFFPSLAERGPVEEVMQSEEHLVVRTAATKDFRIGDAVVAIARHACPVSAVHQFANVIEDGKLVDRWDVVARDRILTI